jgi:UDP-N-acetylmuramyl pentapeptide synthase
MRVLEIISTMGPGRRANVKVIEMVLLADADEASQFETIAHELQQRLPAKLAELGLAILTAGSSGAGHNNSGIAGIAAAACSVALALQNAAGHDLGFHDFLQDQDPASGEWRYRFIFQHDDIPSGEQAGDLAMRILSEACPGLRWQVLLHEATQSLPTSIEAFLSDTKPFVTPAETLGLIAAAQARRIPVLRLEREPYGKLPASFRVAPNGMVMLGHSRHRVIMDGLFCIARPGPGFDIMKDRRALWGLLAALGFKAPVEDLGLMVAATPARARRAARRLGYPVRIRPLQRSPFATDGWRLKSESDFDVLLSRPGMDSGGLMIEPELPGPTMKMLFVGGKLLVTLLDDQIAEASIEAATLAQRIEQTMDCGFLLVSFKRKTGSPDPDKGWQVTDVNPSPAITTLLRQQPSLLNTAYEIFLDWLFPPGQPCRIPIISITGTNGKTTTSSMIARIAQLESLFVGMARTTGVYFDRELREFGDSSGFLGHCMVFEHPEVDLAVLETARGDVLRAGFAYDFSNVAICTNVTADHLGEHGVETIADMAVIKRSVLERSAGAVVLNGDDPLCLGMLPDLHSQTLYVSTFQADHESLRQRVAAEYSGRINIIHVAQQDGEEWIVLREGNASTDVIAVNAIPATFNGAARHNISNAMHAISGAHALGLRMTSIRQALAGFEMGYESLPGRLNVHDNGRFHIIMDYAHNADGLKQLVRFCDQFPCQGRKILRFGVSPKASEAACLGAAATVAGHFDHYICSAKPGYVKSDGVDTAAVLQRGLMLSGVTGGQVEVFTDMSRSVEYPASLCHPGDLLVLVTSNAAMAFTWEQVIKT